MTKRWQHPSVIQPILSEALQPETITLDKWYSPFTDPIHKAAGKLMAAALITSGLSVGDLSPPTSSQSFEVFISEPQSVRLFQYQIVSEPVFVPPGVVSLDKWWRPLSEPIRVKKPLSVAARLSSWNDNDALTRPEVTSLDKWFAPLAEPPTPDPRNEAALIASGGIFRIDVGDLDVSAEQLAWYKDLELHLSVYTKKRAPEFPAYIVDADQLTQPEVTSLDKWHSPLSEPVLVKKPLPVASYPASWDDSDALTRPEATSLDKWWSPLSEPASPHKLVNVSFGEARTELELVVAEDITLDKWFQPHSEPVLVKPRASDFPSHTNDTEGLTLPEVPSLDKWWAAASEPLRIKQPLNVSFGEFRTELEIVVAEVITLDKWWQPLSEPDKTKKRASEFPHFVTDSEALTLPEVTTLDKWYRNLDEPIRVQPRSLAGLLSGAVYEGELSDVEPLAEFMGWFVELSVPTLPKPRVVEFPAYVIDTEALTLPETTSLDKWFVELSEPLRTKPPLSAGAIPTLIESLEPIIILVLGWDVPLSEPIFIIDPTTPLKPSFFIDPEALTLPEATTLDKWFTPLSEPVRIGDRLIVPRLPAVVGFKLPITITVPIKSFISKEADQTHISKEADQTKNNPRC